MPKPKNIHALLSMIKMSSLDICSALKDHDPDYWTIDKLDSVLYAIKHDSIYKKHSLIHLIDRLAKTSDWL